MTLAIGWVLGPFVIVFEVVGKPDPNLKVLVLGMWLILLPVVATNPLEAIRQMLREWLQ